MLDEECKITDDLDLDVSQASSDLSHVCRTMAMALFAPAIVDLLSEYPQPVSPIIITITICIIFLDIVQYSITTILSRLWLRQVHSRRIDGTQLNSKQSIWQGCALIILFIKVIAICVSIVLVMILLSGFKQ